VIPQVPPGEPPRRATGGTASACAAGVHSALVVVVVLAGCTASPRLVPREPSFPVVATYTSTMVGVRSTLGRALIGVETQGIDRELRTAPCDDRDALRSSCAHCELAAATDAIALPTFDAIKTAIDRYPTSVLEASKIQHVALCRTLYEEPHSMLAGTVDLANHRMFVNLESFIGKKPDPDRSPTVDDIVHHELYHLLEWAVLHDIMIDDVAWRAQNPAGFAYRKPAEGDTRPFGFVNVYASTNDHEDRASVFELLMSRPDQLCAMAQDDPIVRAKTSLLWGRLAIAVGDGFLRQRASCATWIEPAKPPAVVERPASRPALPWGHAPAYGEQRWLAPPVRPRSLR
jgi:hypothetical protein